MQLSDAAARCSYAMPMQDVAVRCHWRMPTHSAATECQWCWCALPLPDATMHCCYWMPEPEMTPRNATVPFRCGMFPTQWFHLCVLLHHYVKILNMSRYWWCCYAASCHSVMHPMLPCNAAMGCCCHRMLPQDAATRCCQKMPCDAESNLKCKFCAPRQKKIPLA